MTNKEDVSAKIKAGAVDAASAAKEAARNAASTAKQEVHARADAAKDGVAGEMHDTAGALRRAANEVRDGSPQGAAFSYLADGLADMADSVKGQEVSGMVRGVSDFARRNPIAFLGGAALLGFAATRFAKAQTPEHRTYAEPRRQAPKPSAYATAYNPNVPQSENRYV